MTLLQTKITLHFSSTLYNRAAVKGLILLGVGRAVKDLKKCINSVKPEFTKTQVLPDQRFANLVS
ncbi:MAG: hypothetical protein AAF724_06535 [Pseudomonadota bacterium]